MFLVQFHLLVLLQIKKQVFHKNGIVFLNHILLEDLVKFCKTKGKVIRGCYYNDNREQRIRDVIEEIFQLNVANKKTPVEQIIKIVLNSIY
jgi:hypothetical protein